LQSGDGRLAVRAQTCRVTAVAVCPSNRVVALGGADRHTRLICLATGTRLAELGPHTGWVTCLLWSPDSLTLLCGSYHGHVRAWAVPATLGRPGGNGPGVTLRSEFVEAEADAAAGAPEERMVTALLFEPPEVQPAKRRSDRYAAGSAAAPPSSGLRVYVGAMSGRLSLWDLNRRRCVGAVTPADASAISSLAAIADCAGVDGDGVTRRALALSAHRDGSLRAWRAPPQPTSLSRPPPLQAAWARVGAHADWATHLVPWPCHAPLHHPLVILSGGEDGRLCAWRLASGAPCGTGWQRQRHHLYPDGFRAALRTFLLCLHRLRTTSGDAAAPNPCALSQHPAKAPTPRRRGRPGSATPPPLGPTSPEPASSSASSQLQRRRSLAPALPLHGATHDALVDLIAASLARLLAE